MTFSYLQNSPIIAIRSQIIDQIMNSGIVDDVTYPAQFNSKIPVVPIQQLPETNNTLAGKPFIVYELEMMPNNNQAYWQKCEEITFYIYGTDYMKIIALQDLFVDYFGRMDKTAADLNTQTVVENLSFLTCFVSANSSTSAKESEIANYAATITIEYDYVRPINFEGRRVEVIIPTPPEELSIQVAGADSDIILDGYRVVTWRSSGSIEVSGGTLDVEYLVVGGGGAGGVALGAGGGAGGLVTNVGGSLLTITGYNPVTIGAGGAGSLVAPSTGNNGSDSTFASITALGGGGGGSISTAPNTGGSGGGGSSTPTTSVSGAPGTEGQGFAGGNGITGAQGGAGGGGAGQAGQDTVGANVGGDGGDGIANAITGTSVYYAGGGGGAFASTGGAGGGASCGAVNSVNVPGVDGTGGGGAGWTGSNQGSWDGGDGIVILKWAV